VHNYSNANSAKQKMYNWGTLNQKVFRRLGFVMDKGEVESLVNCKPGAVELLLMRLQKHITEIRAGRRSMGSPHGALEMGGASGASHSAEEGGYDGGNGPTFNLYAGSNNNNNNNNAGGTNSSSSNTNVSQVNAPQAPRQQPSTHAPVAAPQLAAVPHQTHSSHHHDVMVDAAILSEKDATIRDLQETVEILELKIRKLEQLVKLKDSRIQTLTARLGGGVAPQ
jgi:hypothetical protein